MEAFSGGGLASPASSCPQGHPGLCSALCIYQQKSQNRILMSESLWTSRSWTGTAPKGRWPSLCPLTQQEHTPEEHEA